MLQKDLKNLEKWELTWKMDFNPSKCFTMNVTRKRNPMISDYVLKDSVLENVEKSPCLGEVIRKDLKLKDHVDNITMKANRTLGLVKRNINSNNMVRPVLDYASSVWDLYCSQF